MAQISDLMTPCLIQLSSSKTLVKYDWISSFIQFLDMLQFGSGCLNSESTQKCALSKRANMILHTWQTFEQYKLRRTVISCFSPHCSCVKLSILRTTLEDRPTLQINTPTLKHEVGRHPSFLNVAIKNHKVKAVMT